MFLAILSVVSFCSEYKRAIPFIPVQVRDANNELIIRNYFDLAHLTDRRLSTSELKTCMSNLKAGIKIPRQIERLQELIEMGEPDASFILGAIYEYGLFEQPMNDTKARHFYELGAKHGHYQSRSSLSFFLMYGIGGEKDTQRAHKLISKSRGKSIDSMLHDYITNYHFGKGCQFEKLEKLGYLVSKNTSYWRKSKELTALLRFPGILPIGKDKTMEMLELTKMKAKSGDNTAYYELAALLIDSVRPDYENGIKYLEKAAEVGLTRAMLQLAMMKIGGNHVPMDVDGGIALLHKAALAGDTDALAELAILFLKTSDEKSRASGQELLAKAVEAGSVEATYHLAKELLNGKIPYKRNISEAIRLFSIVARTPHFDGRLSLSTLQWENRVKVDNKCDSAMESLQSYLESSFLYDDGRIAYDSVTHGDLEFAFKIYRRLAGFGNEIAAWNALKLTRRLGLDTEVWSDLQVQLNHKKAFKKETGQKIKSTKDKGIMARTTDPKMAFKLAWNRRWRNLETTLNWYNRVNELQGKSGTFAVRFAMMFMFLEGLSDVVRRQKSTKSEFFWMYLSNHCSFPAFAILLVILYLLIGRRIKVMTRVV